tara:strand:+ start:151 stop:870 length:720 start_codon:yes stop_codon:yes gene_type:complete
MNINDEKKLNEEWLAFIRGDVVINANKKWRLHAKLVRSAILNIMAEEERHLNTSYDRDLLKFKNALIEKGILKNKKESINNRFLKWLGALVFGATIVWAANELIRFDKPIPTESQVAINNPEYESEKPLSNIRDKFGTFTAFWPYLKIFSPERFDDPIQIVNTQCGHGGLEKLNLEDCLVLAEQNNMNALFNLGLMYEKGISVKQNFQKAYEYYKKAEKLGNKQATFNIDYLKEKKLIN